MNQSGKTLIGIDVGGSEKGFHAVALRNGQFEPEPQHFTQPEQVVAWCQAQDTQVIAIAEPNGS